MCHVIILFIFLYVSVQQVLQESVPLSGTNVHLVYHSSEAAGYMSLVRIQMTPDTVPRALRLVHLRVAVEGVVVEKVFEADPNLKYTFAWNRLNVYKQKVYGIVTARGKHESLSVTSGQNESFRFFGCCSVTLKASLKGLLTDTNNCVNIDTDTALRFWVNRDSSFKC